MPDLYLNQFIVIREMLNSSLPGIVQEACNLLFNLWQEYADNPDFDKDLRQLVTEYPTLIQEIEIRIQKMPQDDVTKDRKLLREKFEILAAEMSKDVSPSELTNSVQDKGNSGKYNLRIRIIVLVIVFDLLGTFLIILISWILEVSSPLQISMFLVLLLLNYSFLRRLTGEKR
jgi:hypothetical protein